jgi:hypothetical protein
MLAEISAGFSSLKAAFDITKGLNSANTQASINDVKIPLQEHIIEAQQALSAAGDAQTAAAGRITQLEQEIVRLEDWSAEKERYQLKNIWRGSVAYVLKPGMENGEPPHWLCANCFSRSQRSFLYFKGQDRRPTGALGDESTYACDVCKSSMKVEFRQKPMPEAAQ